MLASVVVIALFVWQGNKGFSLWDEGFLWYGAQRVTLGEVPIRDFMAYDPGRYYWVAAVMELCGSNGIMAMRIALAIFQAIGLFVGLLLIARALKKQSLVYLLLSTLILTAWMFPRYKLFDVSLSIFLVGALTYLVEKPVGRRYFLAGMCVGLAAVFGRNHGVYGVTGSLGVIAWLTINRSESYSPVSGLLAWSAGVITGYCPILLMLIFVPGFAAAFLEDIRYLFEIRTTNIPLPVQWPWRVHFTSLPTSDAVREILIGTFFIGLLIFGAVSLLWVVRQRMLNRPVSPTLVAASFLVLPYAHFAYSRADISHLAQGIFPMLVGIMVALSRQAAQIKWPLAAVICAASIWVMIAFQPGWECRDGKCVGVEISHSMLQTAPGTARDIALLRTLADKYAAHGRSFIAAPYWPGAYALLERKSPVWEIYPLQRRSGTFEQDEIKRIEAANPGFALIDEMPLDGVDALRFSNTHPLIYQYILNNFVPLPGSPNPYYHISKANSQAQ
ncbi:hypothetical protein GCM10007898_16640 [Dyella flagellata]|uniref:Glycosyltransferase RgtA/B/C/D-like domain-containing protein n=2 Tax=Dyella flagellata TaxID=1867833 RepID=A0ABQ5XC51_9GAMM|nr:hypothetical protein GCM10007898_16640 [Dyella flagellata]